jgi:hypothetical protein
MPAKRFVLSRTPRAPTLESVMSRAASAMVASPLIEINGCVVTCVAVIYSSWI